VAVTAVGIGWVERGAGFVLVRLGPAASASASVLSESQSALGISMGNVHGLRAFKNRGLHVEGPFTHWRGALSFWAVIVAARAPVAVAQVGWRRVDGGVNSTGFNQRRLRDNVLCSTTTTDNNAATRKWDPGPEQQRALPLPLPPHHHHHAHTAADAALVWCPHRPSRRNNGLAQIETCAAPPLV